jgi:hypothetical protein
MGRFFRSLQKNPISNRKMNCNRVRTDYGGMRFLIRSRFYTFPTQSNRKKSHGEAACYSSARQWCYKGRATWKDVLDEGFHNRDHQILARYNVIVEVVEEALLKYLKWKKSEGGYGDTEPVGEKVLCFRVCAPIWTSVQQWIFSTANI